MTTTSLPDPPAPRPLPLWMSVPIVLLCLAGGTGIIACYLGTHVRADQPHVLGDVPPPPPRQAVAGGRPRGGLGNLLGGGNRPRVQVGNAEANGSTPYTAVTAKASAQCLFPRNAPPVLRFIRYVGGAEFPLKATPPDVQKVMDQGRKLARDDKAVAALKLTDDQRRRLQRLSALPEMAASEADRALLVADFKAYQADPRGKTPTPKLLADLDAIADRSADATRAAVLDRAAKLTAVITPDQWKQYAAMGG